MAASSSAPAPDNSFVLPNEYAPPALAQKRKELSTTLESLYQEFAFETEFVKSKKMQAWLAAAKTRWSVDKSFLRLTKNFITHVLHEFDFSLYSIARSLVIELSRVIPVETKRRQMSEHFASTINTINPILESSYYNYIRETFVGGALQQYTPAWEDANVIQSLKGHLTSLIFFLDRKSFFTGFSYENMTAQEVLSAKLSAKKCVDVIVYLIENITKNETQVTGGRLAAAKELYKNIVSTYISQDKQQLWITQAKNINSGSALVDTREMLYFIVFLCNTLIFNNDVPLSRYDDIARKLTSAIGQANVSSETKTFINQAAQTGTFTNSMAQMEAITMLIMDVSRTLSAIRAQHTSLQQQYGALKKQHAETQRELTTKTASIGFYRSLGGILLDRIQGISNTKWEIIDIQLYGRAWNELTQGTQQNAKIGTFLVLLEIYAASFPSAREQIAQTYLRQVAELFDSEKPPAELRARLDSIVSSLSIDTSPTEISQDLATYFTTVWSNIAKSTTFERHNLSQTIRSVIKRFMRTSLEVIDANSLKTALREGMGSDTSYFVKQLGIDWEDAFTDTTVDISKLVEIMKQTFVLLVKNKKEFDQLNESYVRASEAIDALTAQLRNVDYSLKLLLEEEVNSEDAQARFRETLEEQNKSKARLLQQIGQLERSLAAASRESTSAQIEQNIRDLSEKDRQYKEKIKSTLNEIQDLTERQAQLRTKILSMRGEQSIIKEQRKANIKEVQRIASRMKDLLPDVKAPIRPVGDEELQVNPMWINQVITEIQKVVDGLPELSQSKTTQETQLLELSARLGETTDAFAAKQEELRVIQSQYSALQEDYKQITEALDNLQKTYLSKFVPLGSGGQRYTSIINELIVRMKNVSAGIEIQTKRIRELESAVAQKNAQLSQHVSTLSAASSTEGQYNERIERLTALVKQRSREKHQAEQEKEQLQAKLSDVETQLHNTSGRAAANDAKVRELTESLTRKESVISTLRSQIEDFNTQVSALKAQIRNGEDSLGKLQRSFDDATAEIARLKDERDKMRRLTVKLENKVQKQHQLQEEFDRLKVQFQSAATSSTSENTSLKNNLGRAEQSLRDATRKVSDLEYRVRTLSAENESNERKIASFETLIRELSDNIAKLQVAKSETNADKMRIEGDLRDTMRRLEQERRDTLTVKARISDLEKEVFDSNLQKKELEQRIVLAERQINAQNEELARAQQNISQDSHELATLRSEKARLDQIIDDFKNNSSVKDADLQTLDELHSIIKQQSLTLKIDPQQVIRIISDFAAKLDTLPSIEEMRSVENIVTQSATSVDDDVIVVESRSTEDRMQDIQRAATVISQTKVPEAPLSQSYTTAKTAPLMPNAENDLQRIVVMASDDIPRLTRQTQTPPVQIINEFTDESHPDVTELIVVEDAHEQFLRVADFIEREDPALKAKMDMFYSFVEKVGGFAGVATSFWKMDQHKGMRGLIARVVEATTRVQQTMFHIRDIKNREPFLRLVGNAVNSEIRRNPIDYSRPLSLNGPYKNVLASLNALSRITRFYLTDFNYNVAYVAKDEDDLRRKMYSDITDSLQIEQDGKTIERVSHLAVAKYISELFNSKKINEIEERMRARSSTETHGTQPFTIIQSLVNPVFYSAFEYIFNYINVPLDFDSPSFIASIRDINIARAVSTIYTHNIISSRVGLPTIRVKESNIQVSVVLQNLTGYRAPQSEAPVSVKRERQEAASSYFEERDTKFQRVSYI